jgi:8-oxo-dGTP pyrophosphatase MutT (NUDIX family)
MRGCQAGAAAGCCAHRQPGELPGGIIDGGEDGAATAAREAEEETGWRPGPLSHLLTFQPMVGMVDTPHEIYVGHGASRVDEPTDLEEAGRVSWVPLTAVLKLINKGEVLGAGSLVGLLHLLATRASPDDAQVNLPRPAH